MRYRNVTLESFGYSLPSEVVTTPELEHRLKPIYQRLRLPTGRLELITGVRERRFFPNGTRPSKISAESAERAISAANIERSEIGVLVHGSVCRDFLEPATACSVHHALQLPSDCLIYDLSNACLGLLNGIIQVANMIELGQVRAGIVVGTEDGRALVENTVRKLNQDDSLTRKQIKRAIASLTIGSGSCAILLTHRDVSQTQNRILTGTARANTAFNHLCQSESDESIGGGSGLLMNTDSESLMEEGIATGAATFRAFLEETGWQLSDLHKTFGHQVGPTHRKLLLERLGLNPQVDFATVDWLGNTGSVALPLTMAIGLERGHVQQGEHLGMLGIGSGINCLMLGVEWHRTLVGGDEDTVYDSAGFTKPETSIPRPHASRLSTAKTTT